LPSGLNATDDRIPACGRPKTRCEYAEGTVGRWLAEEPRNFVVTTVVRTAAAAASRTPAPISAK